MAPITHFSYTHDFGAGGIPPQGTSWLSYGPEDLFNQGAVAITASPGTEVAGTVGPTHAVMALEVTETFVHQYPTVLSGGFILRDTHVGVRILNAGSAPIRYVTIRIAVITP